MLYDYYFVDWYSILHFWWGTLYAVVFSPISIDGLDFQTGFFIALAIAVLFEIAENSNWYMQHIKCPGLIKFSRDSWANMIGDVCSSSCGYAYIWIGGVNDWVLLFLLSNAIALIGGIFITQCIDPQDKDRQRNMWITS